MHRALSKGEMSEAKHGKVLEILAALAEEFEDEFQASYTKLHCFKVCPKMYDYKYNQGLLPKERILKVELGKYCHYIKEHLNKGMTVREASEAYWDEMTEGMFDEEVEDFQEIRTTAELIMYRYQDFYKDIDGDYELISCEDAQRIPIPGTNAVLKFIPDEMVKDKRTGKIYLVDHKVTSVDFSAWEDKLVLDEQANMYIWGMNQIRDEPISGVIFNLIRSKLPTVPKVLKAGGLSKAKNIDTDYETYMAEIVKQDLDPNDYAEILDHIKTNCKPFFKRYITYRTPEELEQIGNEIVSAVKKIQAFDGSYYRNPGQHCGWGCSYEQLCVMDAKHCDTEEYKRFSFDTYEDRKAQKEAAAQAASVAIEDSQRSINAF